MLTFGPVTTQILAMFSATPHSIATHNHKAMNHAPQNDSITSSIPTHKTTQTTEKQQPHHWMSQCGYCDLLHSPVLTTYTSVIIQVLPIQPALITHYQVDILSPFYNTALSRAPPSFIAALLIA